MKSELKSLVKRWPALYRLAQTQLWKVRKLRERRSGLLMGEFAEQWWAERHQREGKDWVMSYWNTRNDPHRFLLLKELEGLSPFSSVLEVGSNCGPSLYVIAKRFPDIVVRGVDINPTAVLMGNALLGKEGIQNAKIFTSPAGDLSQFADTSFDIVFTNAVLVHVGSDKIEGVVREMLRVAKKALVLIERHREIAADQQGLGVRAEYTYPCDWDRNYRALLKRFVPENSISLYKVPEEIWTDEWYCIKVRL
ncbi:MAG: class I SAM-dependent methyltransferase [bacterium]|nr:class I SAM-dependent methyltransferase [bacterium]